MQNSKERASARTVSRNITTLARCGILALASACALNAAQTVQATKGAVTGRVFGESGNSLVNAIVKVKGTNIQVATNQFGEYTIENAPVGTQTLTVTYTGQPAQDVSVFIKSGSLESADVVLGGKAAGKKDDATIVLDTFNVDANRYRTAQELAVNEERNSITMKNVVAADSLGYVADGNVGDFVKYIPGVEVGSGGDYVNGADTSSINVRGFGAENTAILVDGMPVTSPSPASLTRAVNIDMMSINNASYIEVIKVPSPDMENNSAGGSINLVTRSAFDFARPQISASLSASINSLEKDIFKKSPGPANKNTFHTLPGARVSVSLPVTRNFGVTMSVSSDNKYSPNYKASSGWNLKPVVWNGSILSNSAGESGLSNPYLSQIQYTDNPWITYRTSGNLKLDWKPVKDLLINANVQYSQYTGNNVARALTFNPGSPTEWDASHVYGRLYATGMATNPNNKASMVLTARDKSGDTTQAYLKVKYKIAGFNLDANGMRSVSNGRFDDMQNGHFSGLDLKMSPGQVNFDGINDGLPSKVTMMDRTGAVVDYTRLSNWVVDGSLVAKSGEAFQKDTKDQYRADLSRDFSFWGIRAIPKIGYAYNESMQKKWGRGTGYQMQYIGPALAANDLLDSAYYRSPGFGMARQQWADMYKLYDIYQSNPANFDPNYSAAMMVNNYVSQVNQTKHVKDKSHAYYAMIDFSFFRDRLQARAGVRKQQNSLEGYQPITDSKYNYVKNADGTVYKDAFYVNGVRIDGAVISILDSTGNVVRAAADAVVSDAALIARMKAVGAVFPDHVMWANNGATVGTIGTNANNVELAKLRLAPRTLRKKRSNPETPSVSFAYKVTNGLKLQVSWSRETSLPNLEDSTTGGVLASNGNLSIDENLTPDGSIGSEGTIKASNPGLKPKETNSYNIGLSYYTRSGGSISASYYYKITTNVWEDYSINNTYPDYDEILEGLGLDPSVYSNYTLKTTVNGASRSKTTGYEFEFKHDLSFFGPWGKRFATFANYTHRQNDKNTISNSIIGQFQIQNRDVASAGIAYGAPRFSTSIRALFKESGYTKNSSTYTYQGNTYAVYNYLPSDLKFNFQFNYRISKTYSAFFSMDNIFNNYPSKKVYDPLTKIIPVYAYNSGATDYGRLINLGVSATW